MGSRCGLWLLWALAVGIGGGRWPLAVASGDWVWLSVLAAGSGSRCGLSLWPLAVGFRCGFCLWVLVSIWFFHFPTKPLALWSSARVSALALPRGAPGGRARLVNRLNRSKESRVITPQLRILVAPVAFPCAMRLGNPLQTISIFRLG